ncbi:MAG: chorismate-binding protein, partial [Capnocytophaga granulosa]
MQENKFIETIKLLDSNIFHIEYHQKRIKDTFSHFFPSEKVFSLEDILSKQVLPEEGKYKIRFVYSAYDYTLE